MRLSPWFAGLVLPWLAWGAAAGGALPLVPGQSYFTDEFDPTLVPWRPAPERNVEEVFKNHEYFEIVLGVGRTTMAVIRHRQGQAPERREYALLPTGALAPIPGESGGGRR